MMTNDDLGAKIETLVDNISKLKVSQEPKISVDTPEHVRIGKPLTIRISQMSQMFGIIENYSGSELDWIAFR